MWEISRWESVEGLLRAIIGGLMANTVSIKVWNLFHSAISPDLDPTGFPEAFNVKDQ